MKTYSQTQNKTLFKLFFLVSLIAQFSFVIPLEIAKCPSTSFMMNCVDAIWNQDTECVTVSNMTPACSPVVSSTYEWRDESGIWRPVPSSGQLCGCDVYEYLDVTPVCQVVISFWVEDSLINAREGVLQEQILHFRKVAQMWSTILHVHRTSIV